MNGLTSSHFRSFDKQLNTVPANLVYISMASEEEKNTTQATDLYFDSISVKDMYGNR